MRKIRLPNFLHRKWTHRYRLVMMDDQTFHEKFSVKLTLANVVVLGSLVSLLLIVLTVFIIAFTPLREYIPGYGDIKEKTKVLQLARKMDSLQIMLEEQENYTRKIVQILSHHDTTFLETMKKKWEETYLMNKGDASSLVKTEQVFLISPLTRGFIIQGFDISQGHYGIDLSSKESNAVRAVADGVVVFADWTMESGNTIIIVHSHQMISVYMHNAILLKKKGDAVRRGEVVAMMGNTGKTASGYHLHFELWLENMPVNPLFYIAL